MRAATPSVKSPRRYVARLDGRRFRTLAKGVMLAGYTENRCWTLFPPVLAGLGEGSAADVGVRLRIRISLDRAGQTDRLLGNRRIKQVFDAAPLE